jgi:hypothetical protein
MKLGKIFKSAAKIIGGGLLGGGSKKTKVSYTQAPEVSAILQKLLGYAADLEKLLPTIEPSLKNVYTNLVNQMEQWMQSYPSKIYETTDVFKEKVHKDVEGVKESILRDLYRDLGARGLISTSAATEAITDTMRKLELEPILGAEKMAFTQQLGFLEKLPEFYRNIAEIETTETMVPWNLRESLMQRLTGVGGFASSSLMPVVKQPQAGLLEQIIPFAAPFLLGKFLKF